MGRPRTATAVLEARGAYKKNPQRLAEREDEPSGVGPIGNAPETLTDEAIVIWGELKKVLPKGVATGSDRMAFALLCDLAAQSRAGVLEPKLLTQYIKLLGLFGLTPADRSRLKIAPEKEKKKDESFAGLTRVK